MDKENKYGTKEVQYALLLLLKNMDAFFIKNKIPYSLDSGTLLGAVRHNGFIPWDDDIDIIIDRDTYDRLCSLDFRGTGLRMERDLWIDRIKFSNDYIAGIKSRQNPTIDVFILDNAPDNKYFRKLCDLLICFVQGMIKPKPKYDRFSIRYKLLSFIAYNLGLLMKRDTKVRLYHLIATCCRNKKTQYKTCYFYEFNEIGKVFNSDVFIRTEKHLFEDSEFSIISQYDEYLTTLYGDWHTPPPESERKPLHLAV